MVWFIDFEYMNGVTGIQDFDLQAVGLTQGLRSMAQVMWYGER